MISEGVGCAKIQSHVYSALFNQRYPLNPLIEMLQRKVEILGNKIRVLEGDPPDFPFP